MPMPFLALGNTFSRAILKSQVPWTVIKPHTVQPTEKLKNTSSIYTGNSFSSCIFQWRIPYRNCPEHIYDSHFQAKNKPRNQTLKVLKNNTSLLEEGAAQLFLVTGITLRAQARLRKVATTGRPLLSITIPFPSVCLSVCLFTPGFIGMPHLHPFCEHQGKSEGFSTPHMQQLSCIQNTSTVSA